LIAACAAAEEATMPYSDLTTDRLDHALQAPVAPPTALHRVYIIWPFRHISHTTETESADLAIAAFVQLMRMRHKSIYAIGVGWEIDGRLKKYLDFGSGIMHELA
jgi:hypothetical protein